MPPTLLFVGDIHLGRRPTGLPDVVADSELKPADLSPVAAWRATVSLAIDRSVEAVVLAGDVVEGLNDRFEAWGPLASGVQALASAGIPIYAVAGNHDVNVLPRLADHIDGFNLIGRGGRWQLVDVPCRSGASVRLLGWSFPTQRFSRDPLETLPALAESDRVTLGVLHCDLDAGHSTYAPVSSSALSAAPVDAWLLGHTHKPSALAGPRPVGYLGSLVGLDAGEMGRRGPWLVTAHRPGNVSVEQVPLGPLRWERADVSVDGIGGSDESYVEDALSGALREALHDLHRKLGEEADNLRVVSCRLTLTGRNESHRLLRRALERIQPLPHESIDEVLYVIEKVRDDSRPALDLAKLASGSDPPALVARCVLALRENGEESHAILARARKFELVGIHRELRRRIDQSLADDDGLREILLRVGLDTLEELLAQPSARGAS